MDPDGSTQRFREYKRTRDRALRNQLIEEHLDLARTLARRFSRRGEPQDDLQQVAMLGMLKAVERFDPDRGTPFEPFAVPTVLGELRRHFRDHGWMVRVPRRVQDLHQHMDQIITDLGQRFGRSPTAAELADAAGVREEDVLETMEVATSYRPVTIDLTATGNETDAGLGLIDGALDSADDRVALNRLLQRLPHRERRILYLRYFEERTQDEIARELGVSQMHVSRLLTRSLAALAALEARTSSSEPIG